ELMEGSDYEIIMPYQLEYRGIAEYYRLAYNMSKLIELKWIMERSLTKTLAAKHKLSVPKVYERYRAKRMIDGKEYKVLQASLPRPDKKPLIAAWGVVSLKWDMKATLQDEPPKFYGSNRTELERRLLADF